MVMWRLTLSTAVAAGWSARCGQEAWSAACRKAVRRRGWAGVLGNCWLRRAGGARRRRMGPWRAEPASCALLGQAPRRIEHGASRASHASLMTCHARAGGSRPARPAPACLPASAAASRNRRSLSRHPRPARCCSWDLLAVSGTLPFLATRREECGGHMPLLVQAFMCCAACMLDVCS